MTELQPQDAEQLTPPFGASPQENDGLTPGEPGQSTLRYVKATQPSSVAGLAIAFMEGVKAEFGAQSRETSAIVNSLVTFGKGNATKRETLRTILQTLQGHDHLERDLMAILNHPDARWDRDDFDALPLQQPVPRFLQPAHEPKIRLPALTAPWNCGDDRMLSAADTALSSVVEQDVAIGTEKVTFPTRDEQDRWYQPARSMVSSPRLSNDDPHSSQRNDTQSWPIIDQNAGMDASQLTLGGALQHNPSFPYWQDSYRGPTLGEENINQLFAHETFENNQLAWSGGPINFSTNPSLLGRSESVTAVGPHQLKPARPPGSILAPDPLDMYREKRDLAMLPPSRKRSHYTTDLQSHIQGKRLPGGEVDQAGLDPEEGTSYSLPADTSSKRGRVEGSGPYIHALCGKGFSSRYKVKKHHWGNEMDNVHTTTGCWNKHKKPDCTWDDHPSCKEQPKAPASVRPKVGPISRQQGNSTMAGIPPEPEHAPQDLSTPRELHTIMEQHNNKPAPPKSCANEDINYSPYPLYHAHTLPASSSPFESLLTAVNLAAEIESPMPQRRNDSAVASNLNAHAIAAEHFGEYKTDRYYSQATHAEGNSFDYYESLPQYQHGTSPSMHSPPAANSMNSRVGRPLHTYSGDHAFSTQGDSGPMYWHSYLNSRNSVAWPPTARTAAEYSPTFFMRTSEDRAAQGHPAT